MEKLRGELWEGRAVDGKLKSSLEWPNRPTNYVIEDNQIIYKPYLIILNI